MSHWLEFHSDSNDPPEFEWNIIDCYKDALRRQLGEKLYIMDAGLLNTKCEFNQNIICRMEARSDGVISDKVLQQEVLNRRLHMERIRKFVVEKRISAPSVLMIKIKKLSPYT